MIAIYKRELKAYFHSLIGWLFCAVTLFFVSLYFASYNLLGGYGMLAYALSGSSYIFIISVPILTMRILAEERKQKIDQLILTAPVSVWKVVLGKYLAMATVYMIPMIITCFYPVIMGCFGTVNYVECYVSLLGYILYGLTAIAVGLFISGLTESQVIAAVVSLLVLFLTYMMSGITNMINASGNMATKILSCFDFPKRVNLFYDGTLNVTAIVYFISVLGLLLFLTTQAIQKRRYTVSVKKFRTGAYSSTFIAVVVAVVVFLNLMVNELPEKYQSLDVTSSKLYSITDDTIKLLDTLKEDINIYVLASEENHDTTVEKTLKKYQDASKHIKVEYVDPAKSPAFATKYTDTTPSTGSIIVSGSKRNKVIAYNDLYETEMDYATYQTQVTGYDAEGQITSAIAYVTDDNTGKLYQVTGHGEAEISESFTSAMSKANLEVETLNIIKEEKVPEDAQAVIINVPQTDFSKDDAKKITDYLKNGGNVLAAAGWTEEELTNFNSILEDYGMTLNREVVIEGDQNNCVQSPIYLLPQINSTEYTDTLTGQYVFMPYSVSVSEKEDNDDDSLTITNLLTTSSSAYGKSDIQNAENIDKEENDVDGPFYLGMAAEKSLDKGSSKLVVYTSDSVFSDNADQMVSGGNKALFKNTLNQMVDVETSVSIDVKPYNNESITVPQLTAVILSLVLMILIPVIMLIVGIVVVVLRRKK